MPEIILNPDVEIVHDEDRKLYWSYRQAVDTHFLDAVKLHTAKEDHCYHSCSNVELDKRQYAMKQHIDQALQGNSLRDIMDEMSLQLKAELDAALSNMIALHREANRRNVRLK